MYAVITTIQEPTECVSKLVEELQAVDATLVVAGDKKGPATFDAPGTVFLSLAEQEQMPYSLAGILPTATYARKNLAYLFAFSQQAPCIYETDDDNAPIDAWSLRTKITRAVPIRSRPWVNVYRLFTDELVWPRGFPLRYVGDASSCDEASEGPEESVDAPIQQGLVNGSPDVDAVWRLVMDRELYFEDRPSVALSAGTYCPFSSQSTWWWPEAYPLTYLPSTCSFRMTDIWRSFIAQRCLWAMGKQLVFHAAEVYQKRNTHDLMVDFHDEVSGYLGNERLVGRLDGLTLSGDPRTDLPVCYECLTADGFFKPAELDRVGAWLTDLAAIEKTNPTHD